MQVHLVVWACSVCGVCAIFNRYFLCSTKVAWELIKFRARYTADLAASFVAMNRDTTQQEKTQNCP